MMICYEIEAELQTLLDEGQPASTNATVAEHVAHCTRCAELAAAYEVLNSLASAPEPEPLVGLADRVIDQVVATPAPHVAAKTRTLAWNRWGSLAIAASLLMAAYALVQTSKQAPTSRHAAELTTTAGNSPAQPIASSNSIEADLSGRDMWFRTGRGLASMAIATWQADDGNGALETESAGNQRFLDRAVDRLKEMLPGMKDHKPSGESNRLLSHERPLVA